MILIFRVLILHIAFTLIHGQDESAQFNLLQAKINSSVYCVIFQEKESTAVGLFKDNKPLKSFKYQLNLSKLSAKNFFCNISTNENCKDVLDNKGTFKYDKSDNYDLPAITDKRWEDLDIIESGRLYFVNVYNVTENNKPLELEIKIKIEKNAYIYLCDGMNPLNSNCYWFVIGGWRDDNKNTSKSVARTCRKKELENSYVEGCYLNKDENCRKPPENTNEPHKKDHKEIFLSSSNWTSLLLIEKSNKDYSIENRLNREEIVKTEIMTDFKIDVKHIFITSPSSAPGYWKVNNIDFQTGFLQKIHTFGNKIKSNFHFSFIHPKNTQKDVQKTYITYIYLYDKEHRQKSIIPITNKIISSWKHFKLQKHYHTLKLVSEKEEIYSKYISFQAEYVVVGSRNIAYWKNQIYGIFVAKESSVISIPFTDGIKGQRICVAIFVYCLECEISLQIIDSEENVLITKSSSKKESWEQIKLETSLKKDVKIKLKIILKDVNSIHPAFIGDITDCTGNVRIIGTNSEKFDQISCKSLNDMSMITRILITPKNRPIIVTTSLNITDALWLRNKKSCGESISKKELEYFLKCFISTSNYNELIEEREICSLSFTRKASTSSNLICEVLLTECENYYHLLWLIPPVIILCGCLGSIIYFYKSYINSTPKESETTNTSDYHLYTVPLNMMRKGVKSTVKTQGVRNVHNFPVELENEEEYSYTYQHIHTYEIIRV